MAQTSLNSTGVASTGALSLQSNGTTEAIGISTGQVATLAQNPVLTSGTANGVGYLNGSKVLTTGSRLTFDGSEVFTNSGGTVQLNDIRGSAAAGTRMSAGGTLGTDSFDLFQNSTAGYVFNRANTPLVFAVNATEQMRLTSTGLGIGTSSPSYKLDVLSTALTIGRFTRSGAGGSAAIDIVEGSGGYSRLVTPGGTSDMSFRPGGTELMLLNSSGNLGLGVTPSAWNSSFKAFQVGALSSFVNNGSGNTTDIWSNGYVDSGGNVRYLTTAAASFFRLDGNAFKWFNAASGTAGNAVTFTQAMTLDASGNLLVGITTATPASITAHKLVVERSSTAYAAAFGYSADASARTQVSFYNSNGSVGTISTNGSTTAYNTTSDYRLKNVVGAVSGSGERLDALEPIEYTWKADGSHTRGFLAHKFQEVYAGSVTGTKDAVDEEGNPVYQAMQASSSEVIADLVAEIQSLRKRLAALEAK